MEKKIALVGGSGFIGTELIKILSDGAELINYDKNSTKTSCETILLDVRDKEALLNKMKPADWLILLAAEHTDNVLPTSLYYDVNVTGADNVLAAMDTKGIKNVLFVSSVSVYGLNKKNPTEESLVDPFNDYGKSKWKAEELLRNWYEKDKEEKTLVIVRPAVIFGPKNKGNVHQLLQQIQSGKFVMIGSGNNKKSMAYVENVAGFFRHIIENNFTGYHVYNYADKPDLSMQELVDFLRPVLHKKIFRIHIPYFMGYAGGLFFDGLAKLTNKKYPISSVRIKKFCAVTQFSAEKMLLTGYEPSFTLQEGLEKTVSALPQNEVTQQPTLINE